MIPLFLHEFHQSLQAGFTAVNGWEMVAAYGAIGEEAKALRETAGVIDLSARSRVCLLGADRARYLHGQVTNDVKKLTPGTGCYAALTTAKGKMEGDVNILALAEELLLDFEPGMTAKVTARLEKFVVADEVQIVDAAPHYGLLSVQGPRAAEVIQALAIFANLPTINLASVKLSDGMLGELYLVRHARWGRDGFDLYVPMAALGAVADRLIAAARTADGRAVGWTAAEMVRVEQGIPRYGEDMDETCLPLECGIEARAVVYNKGCYLGQEVINRIHSVGHVNRELRGLRLHAAGGELPGKGTKSVSAT